MIEQFYYDSKFKHGLGFTAADCNYIKYALSFNHKINYSVTTPWRLWIWLYIHLNINWWFQTIQADLLSQRESKGATLVSNI